jgi:hypothetical protein
MNRIGSAREGDTETMLDLKAGTILGKVKKVAGNSTYEIKTPHGVAGIRGTDYQVTVTLLPGGLYQVTFTSLTGIVIVSAIVDGATVVRTLHDGESWTPGQGDVQPTPLNLISEYQSLIEQMETQIVQTGVPSITYDVTTVSAYPSGGGGPAVIEPYPSGGPPGGGASSPNGSTGTGSRTTGTGTGSEDTSRQK